MVMKQIQKTVKKVYRLLRKRDKKFQYGQNSKTGNRRIKSRS